MITNLEFATEPARPGEIRRLIVEASAPIRVKVKCFTSKPPPPGFKTCPECGEIKLASKEPHLLKVPREIFARSGGKLVVEISDAAGDREVLEVVVNPFDKGVSDPGKMPPIVSSPATGAMTVGAQAMYYKGASAVKSAPNYAARCCE